jgi:hypothetical protein
MDSLNVSLEFEHLNMFPQMRSLGEQFMILKLLLTNKVYVKRIGHMKCYYHHWKFRDTIQALTAKPGGRWDMRRNLTKLLGEGCISTSAEFGI